MTYQGLVNEGATCYLNSLLQTLFMTHQFRENIYSYLYLTLHSGMIHEKLQKRIAFPSNYRSCLSICKHNRNRASLVICCEASSGRRHKLSSSTMCNNSVESFSMQLRFPIRIPFGLRNFSGSSLVLILIAARTEALVLKSILIYHFPCATNTHSNFTTLSRNVCVLI